MGRAWSVISCCHEAHGIGFSSSDDGADVPRSAGPSHKVMGVRPARRRTHADDFGGTSMSIDQIEIGTHVTRAGLAQVRQDIAVHVELANVDLLVVELEGTAYALRIAELSTVQRTGDLAPFTHGGPACAGVTEVNGKLVVVHDLAALLGHGACANPGFIAVSRFDTHVGLAMPAVDAYVRVPGTAVARNGRTGTDACIATIVHEHRELVLLDLERLLHTH